MRAICVRCGAERPRYDQVCPACGFRAEGEGLLVAWLLSSEHLSEVELDRAKARVASGEVIRPTERMLEQARKATGTHFATDLGLDGRERLGLLLLSLLVTPLPAWVLAAWWWNERPRAARQALALALPASVLSTAAVWWAVT
jgi:hypothetical protein